MPELDRFYRDNKDRMRLLVVAFMDQKQSVRKYWKAGGVPVVLDSGQLMGAFGVQGVPSVVFLDADGRIAYRKVGFSTAADLAAYLDGVG